MSLLILSLIPAILHDNVSSWTGGSSYYELHYKFAVSKYLSEASQDLVASSTRLRTIFTETDLIELLPVKGHTHGVSAAKRSTASLFMDQVADSSGRDIIYKQGSASDMRNNRRITRTYYWGKDTNVQPKQEKESDNDLVAMVDVDYYMNIPELLSNHFKPMLIYTFQPSSVSKEEGEYKYTFNEYDKVKYTVSGGGCYEHEVWNYAGDSIGVGKQFMGITYSYSIYALERKMVDADHQIILLAPLRKYSWLAAILAKYHNKTPELKRLKIHENGFLRLQVNGTDGLMTHTGKANCYLKATTTTSVDEAIASAARTTKTGLSLGIVRSKMSWETGLKDVNNAGGTTTGAEMLLEYHNQGTKQPYMINALNTGVRSYQWINKIDDIEEETKPSMISFMKPIIDGGFVPVQSKANEHRAVAKRIKELHNTSVVTPFIIKAIDEFVGKILNGRKHFMFPVDIEEVYKRQPKPTQQRILNDAENELPDRETKTFMKREPYQKFQDPRIISTINGPDKRDYSRFTYAISDLIKGHPWYAFGKTPLEIANRVNEVCCKAIHHADNTDFSRMDGRISDVPRLLEKKLMLAAFAPEWHLIILDLLRSQQNLRGKTRFGITYDTLLTRLSGSPETSIFNTITNAFCAFLAYRMSPAEFGFYNVEQAWNMLGIYGGDDGISIDMDAKAAIRAATQIGQKLTVERTKKGNVGIKFLSRQYGPYVWFENDNNSCCDFARVLTKFHLTVHLPRKYTKELKLTEKAYALALTDSCSPVVGDFVQKVLNLFKIDTYENIHQIWNSQISKENQYPNWADDWQTDLFNKQLPDFNHDVFDNWIKTATTETIFDCPENMERIQADVPGDGFVYTEGDIVGKLREQETGMTCLRDLADRVSQPAKKHATTRSKTELKKDRSRNHKSKNNSKVKTVVNEGDSTDPPTRKPVKAKHNQDKPDEQPKPKVLAKAVWKTRQGDKTV